MIVTDAAVDIRNQPMRYVQFGHWLTNYGSAALVTIITVPYYCVHAGEVSSPGILAGEVSASGILAGQIGCQ